MERKQLESAAASYSYLRGLLIVPAGALLIVAGLSNLDWGPLGHTWVFGAAVLLAGAAALGIWRHYNRTYGRVTPTRKQQVRSGIATAIGAALVVGGAEADWALHLPVNGIASAFALVMLFYHAVTIGLRPHHLVVWGGLLAAGLLPFWGGVSSDHKANVGLIMMGVATMIGGVLDHAVLRRSLGSTPGASLGNSSAGA
jgi:hypothetical protein